jgi:hypothetical protein
LLRATLWKLQGNFERATLWATFAGLIIAGLFMAAGLAFVFRDNLFNGVWLAFIGWYLCRAAIQQYQLSMQDAPQERDSIWRRLRRAFGQSSHAAPNAGAPAYGFGPVLVAAEPDEPCGETGSHSGIES